MGKHTHRPPVHYVVWESLPGGLESYITHYTRRMHADREFYIFSLRPTGNGLNKELDDHFDQGSRNNLELYGKYFRYCRAHRGDIFHVMNCGPVMLLITLLAGVRNPVYHIHGTKHGKGWKEKMVVKLAWRLCNLFRIRLVANSQHSSRIFQRDALAVPPVVIYNGFDLERFSQKRWLRSQLRRMTFIGRMDKGKNVPLVIRLFNEIAGRMPELELHLAGIGDLEAEIEQVALASPYRRRIFFHGWVEDIASFYQSADLFVFPSEHESFGNVLAEALLTGLPVLTSDIPVFEEIHGGERAFCLGNPDNYEEVRRNFLKAVDDFPALAQKAYSASDRIEELFDLETHIQAIKKTYEKA
ncbi:MAG: glycosyltransferase family 4 protein [Saprospiraceae bacterium]